MALSIKDPEAERLARELAALTGESLTRQRGTCRSPRVRDDLRAIRERCARYSVLDHRSADEILGYDEHGLPRQQ